MKIKILVLLLALVAVVGSVVYVVVRQPVDLVVPSSKPRWTDGKGDQPAPPPRTPNSSKDYKR